MAPEADERRHLTVLFADLVGSSRIASLIDPEEWQNVVRAYQGAVAEVCVQFEGHIAQFLGDGILIYFGYPMAQEDDAERALLASLAIVEAINSLDSCIAGERLSVRIGVHSGPVVVGQVGSGRSRETLAIGHTMNVAARLQAVAEPGTVVASEATRRLAPGRFVTRDMGDTQLKGIANAVRIHRVLRSSGVRSRLEVTSQLTPMVGRDQELARLMASWEKVCANMGQVAVVGGEPGVGKSRLVLALRTRIAERSHAWLECRCSRYLAGSAFAPIRELVQQGLNFKDADTEEQKIAKLMLGLGHDGPPAAEDVSLMAAFLEIGASDAALGLSAEALRERTIGFLVDWCLAINADQPVLFLIEDMHWCDPSSLEVLDRLIAQVAQHRMLLLMTTRPEFQAPWQELPYFAQVSLTSLTSDQARAMVQHLCADSSLPREVFAHIVARADGVPLHVEELTRMLQESHSALAGGPLDEVAIPETLEGSLMARLDRLSSAKKVAQVASLLGREFDYKVLESVLQIAPGNLASALDELVAAGLVYAQKAGGNLRYVFKHALIQDASYQSMLRSTRRMYHGRTARALQSILPAVVERHPELLAHHLMEAEEWPSATQQWLQAGRQAVRMSANKEAILYLQSGLACVVQVEEPAQRTQQELELLLTMGPPLMATRGYADVDVERGYTRARELCRLLGEPPAVFPVMFGLWTYHCLRANHVTALELASNLAQMAQAASDPGLVVEADLAMGANQFYLGDFEQSRQRLASSIAGYDAKRDESHRYIYGQDPQVGAHGYEAMGRWLLGHTTQALESSEQELALARALNHPFSLTYALTFSAWFHRIRGDVDRCRQLAMELRKLASDRGVAVYRAVGIILSGSAMVEQGQVREGLGVMESGMAEYSSTGSSVIAPYWEGLHADALRRAGRYDESMTALERGLRAVQETDERWCKAELIRFRAVLMADSDSPQDAVEQEFEQAIAIAQGQGAKAWELRATLDLFRRCPSVAQRLGARARIQAIREAFDVRTTATEWHQLGALLESTN